ncbi:MAG: protein lplB [Clostridiales bacterium]|nr:protein lplB [Clostridiales bacterium]
MKAKTKLPVRKVPLRIRMWNARYLYLLLLVPMAWYVIFHYIPMAGIGMAFENYRFNKGLFESPWVGFKHFERLFNTPQFLTALKNTLVISLTRLIVEFPVPMFLAVMLTEMRFTRTAKIYQTVLTLPHFLTWIVLAAIFSNLLNSDGVINTLIMNLGGKRVKFFTDGGLYRAFLYLSSIWKGAGWSAIMYMAVITGIDPALYEAATLDGASRTQRIRYVTLPHLKEIFVVMLVLKIGSFMNGNFEQIFTTYNPSVYNVADTIDTYVYRITFQSTPNYSFSTAVGLFKSVVNFILLIGSDWLAKKISGSGLFGGGAQ